MAAKRLGYIRLYQRLDKILLLFFTSFILLDFIWRPLNSWLAGQLLAGTGYQFLSYNNALRIMTGTPLIFLGMVLLFLVNLGVAYFQIVFLFHGIYNLLGEGMMGVRAYLKKTWRGTLSSLRHLTPSKILFVTFYILVLFPVLRSLLNIYYLDKIKIPTFIMDYLTNNAWLALFFLVLGIGVIMLGVRWMFALPQVLFEGKSVREAIAYSVEKTHKKRIRYFGRFLWLTFKTSLFYLVTITLILGLQFLADSQAVWLTLMAGVLNFGLIKLTYYMMVAYFLIKFMTLVTEKHPQVVAVKRHPILRLMIVLATLAIFSLEGLVALVLPLDTKPLVISHRGVSDGNGVQNTIESLEATATLKPDYVEMDIQETKDGQFVLMHDPNLKTLAGIDATAQDLTLEELTHTTVSENGQTALIPSFEAYLDKADALGQKLLIEIKTSAQDSADMMERFLATYGKRIKEKGHEVQSLDFKVVEATIQYDQAIPVYFILPYNTIFPQTKATGYTMEYSTLDETFTGRVTNTGKKVYDWTINDDKAIQKSFQLDVDGMITDDVTLVQEAVSDRFDEPDLFDRLVDQATNYLNAFAA